MNLQTVTHTHNWSYSGGGKSHILDYENGMIALCGFTHHMFSCLDNVDMQYLKQPDPHNQLCKKCRKAALILLTNSLTLKP